MMEVDQMSSENVKAAMASFYALDGDTYNEKMKSFRIYLSNLTFLSTEELDEFAQQLHKNNKCVFYVDILLHFKMYQRILDLLKSSNGQIVGRILKDWTFFKNIFTCITAKKLVNDVLPLLSFTIRMKVINRIGKTLTNELIANHLFGLLEDKYGITIASVLLPVCSMTCIKSKLGKYDIILSERQLWSIYKKDETFVAYYFAYLLDLVKPETMIIHRYKQLLKRILDRNSSLFWKLFDEYKVSLKVGKYSSKTLLHNREVMLKCIAQHNLTVRFTKRQIYQAAVKHGIQKEYLLSFYPDNSDDFLSSKLKTVPSFQRYVPQKQRFALTNSLFKEKYSDDLLNYSKHFKNAFLMERLTIFEREIMLDNMENNEELLYFYSTKKSVPLLKEKLQSASDLKIRMNLILMFFKTSNVNNSPDTLLDLLNLLYNRYRNDTQILTQFMNSELTTWRQFNVLKRAHWDVINKMLVYLEQTSKDSVWSSTKNTYFQEYFKYLVDTGESIDEHLQTFVNESLERSRMQDYNFNGDAKYAKILYERSEQLLKLKNDHTNYEHVSFCFLQNIIRFDKIHPKSINLADYMYILDYCNDVNMLYESVFIYILNKIGIFHENMEKYYHRGSHNFTIGFFKYCINKSPKQLLKINGIYSKISKINVNIFDLIKCPYVENSIDSFKQSALWELNSDRKTINREFSMKFLCLIDEIEFVRYAEKFEPPEDGKIPPNFDTTRLDIQKCIIKSLPWVSCPLNMTILMRYCKGDYLKFALPSLYKIMFRAPLVHVEEFLRNMYNTAVSVRKHSLCLGRHLLSPNSFGNFMEMVDKQENNLSLRFVILKKSREYFIEMHDDRFYRTFFIENLNKIDDKDRSVFDYLINYTKIPKAYLEDYIKRICQKISVNSEKDIREKKFNILNLLPNYVVENLDNDFISWCLEEHFFEITPFVLKYLFYSKSADHFIFFNKFHDLLTGDIRSKDFRVSISRFVEQFCGKALQMKAVKKFMIFYSHCQQTFPQDGLVKDRFLIDFTQRWFGAHEDVKQFALTVNQYLTYIIKFYTHSIISVYCDALKNFIHKVPIDKFQFIQNFFYTNSLDETCIATIYLLPSRVPSVKNAYHMYVPLLDALEKLKSPVATAYLDLYYDRAQ